MREGWTYKKLGDLYPIIMGKTPPRGVASMWDTKKETNNLWVSIADLSKNEGRVIFETKEQISDEGSQNIKLIPKGALLLSFKLTLGKMAFAGKDLYTNEAIISLFDNDNFDLKYLYYYFSSLNWSELASGNEKVKGKTLNKKSLGEIPVATIPLSEQQRIVSRLDSAFAKIDALKANAKKQLDDAKALFQKALEKAMEPKEGWEEKKLGGIANVFSGYAFKSGTFQKEGKYQVLRIGNIKQNDLRLSDNAVFIDELDSGLLNKSLLKEGDLVVTQTGTRHKRDYGFVAMIERNNLLLNQRNACIRFDNRLSAQFFLFYSYTELYKDSFFANEGGTVGQGNVGLSALKEMVYYAPPLPEQQAIVAQLDQLSEKVKRLQEIQDKIIKECDALKQAILREVFE